MTARTVKVPIMIKNNPSLFFVARIIHLIKDNGRIIQVNDVTQRLIIQENKRHVVRMEWGSRGPHSKSIKINTHN